MLSAIVLAAGMSTRMGTMKQLLPWKDGRTIVESVTATVLSCAGIAGQVRVVVGAGANSVCAHLASVQHPRLKIIQNPDYRLGMLSSIKRGLMDFPVDSEAFMLVLGDQPLVCTRVLETLAETYMRQRPDILIPTSQGRRGHPVIFAASFIPEIMELEGKGGLRDLVHRHHKQVLELKLTEPGILIDLDYPEDYEKYRP